jgi:hypothetical protein
VACNDSRESCHRQPVTKRDEGCQDTDQAGALAHPVHFRLEFKPCHLHVLAEQVAEI